jgi:hypothetical protein
VATEAPTARSATVNGGRADKDEQTTKTIKNFDVNLKEKRVWEKLSDDESFFLSLDDTFKDVEKFVKEGNDLLFQCSSLH